ncbi:M23 family metallopeptidase [Sphingopyxis sp. BSN-002]|uniref:M23 family metallopeptidase n=1 Tax=Sphingopyxis sp. BSN-002 TaxID=2911495 RepID=UPI001EDC22FD|nr:M23 family metallopeptidase [Sphingopyxis sp. BSN-002]UKK84679.1 M23 family metallopeptidase [Sphingopyxis sp. BSN-002]
MRGAGVRLFLAATIFAATVAASKSGAIIIPVEGLKASDLVDSWSKTRAEGRLHRAIDIQAPLGTPVLAAMDGRIEKLFTSKRGGLTIYQRSADGRLILYYAHLQGYRRGLAEGQAVERGQVIATVGASGNADPAFPHLHFQIMETVPGSGWQDGEPVNPYPLLTGRRARP